MLAYLLWHWPPPDTDVSAYERSMIDFNRSLAAASPPVSWNPPFSGSAASLGRRQEALATKTGICWKGRWPWTFPMNCP